MPSLTKKRRLSPSLSSTDLDLDSADTPLPSCEDDIDPSFSFTSAQASSTARDPPLYIRQDSLPHQAASSLPPRLQTAQSQDNISSAASSPCAAYADLSLDSDRDSTTNPSPRVPLHTVHHRALKLMESKADDHSYRSSSPLKRRASSMDPGHNSDDKDDIDMISGPADHPSAASSSSPNVQPARDTSVDIPDAPSIDEVDEDIPPIQVQHKTITTLVAAFNDTLPQEGDVAYVVSKAWVARATAVAEGKALKGQDLPTSIGLVDNSDIILESFTDATGVPFTSLKPGLTLEDYQLFPKDAWDAIVKWHGLADGQTELIRLAHNTAPPGATLPNVQFELYPAILRVHRLWSANSPIPIDAEQKLQDPPAPRFVRGSNTLYVDFLRAAKSVFQIEPTRKVRVWRVPRKLAAGPFITPPNLSNDTPDPSNPQDSWKHFVSTPDFLALADGDERERIDIDDYTTNPNYNGKSVNLHLVGLTGDMSVVLDEQIERNSFVSTYVAKGASAKDRKAISGRGAFSSQSRAASSGRSSPAPQGPLTRGRGLRNKSAGCVGLTNLGNTCYMNSALQCIRSVEELTKFFLTNQAEKEINTTNVLGHGGDIARAYGNLLRNMYGDNVVSAYTPRSFKSVLGKYAPTFSGYGQQDSQEFLGFLLDALQEDTSRITKKPYIPKPDSTDDMIGNEKLIAEMADKVWDITKKRDDSVIADLFVGLYKSTLVCPVCSKVSITFDPFNNLTLQLPVESSLSRTVRYFPLNDVPVVLNVDVDRNGSILTLKEFIAERVGSSAERLIVAENYMHKYYQIYKDSDGPVHDKLQPGDFIDVCELEAKPTNWPDPRPPKKKKMTAFGDDENSAPHWDDPMAERMVVPVLHRRREKSTLGSRLKVFEPPHFIMLTPDEARSENVIRRKILQKVATFTNYPPLKQENSNGSLADSDPSDTSQSTGSDTDSCKEGKVKARSVDGEDDMVDVSMKRRSPKTPGTNPRFPLKNFNTKPPAWLDPDEFLPPELQNLFSLYYFSENSMLPKGSQVENDNHASPLSKRIPKTPETPGSDAMNGTESDGDSNAEASPPTRMADESDEDALETQSQSLPHRPAKGKGKVGNQRRPGKRGKQSGKTYSKKGKRKNKQFRQQPKTPIHFEYDDVDVEEQALDNGPLVRLGEGIIVEWNEEAHSQVWADTPITDIQGRHLEKLDDPELAEREAHRAHRRQHGITLDDCLDEFETEEILAEEDQWYCPRCKDHVRASKKLELWRTPDILVVHLKRFSNSGWRREKLDVHVEFPIENLDLESRVIQKFEGKDEIYDLIAVDDHWGGLGGGHYTAAALNWVDNQWYEYNDSSVSQILSRDRIVSSSAYLLFYRRRSGEPLGGPGFVDILNKYNNPGDYDDEMDVEAGEGKALGVGSPYGSPSALAGAGAALHHQNHGLVKASMISSQSDQDPPAYSSIEAAMGEPHASVERDEGIDMGEMGGASFHQRWSFKSLDNNDGQDDEIASDQAQPSSLDGDNDPFGDHSEMVFTVDAQAPDNDFTHLNETPPTGCETLPSTSYENRFRFVKPNAEDDPPATEIRLDEADDTGAPVSMHREADGNWEVSGSNP